MICKACKFEHPVMQDCKVAARIRASNAAKQKKVAVAKPENVTPAKSVTLHKAASVTSFEHPKVYPDSGELGWDKLDWPEPPKSGAQRVREHRARKAA